MATQTIPSRTLPIGQSIFGPWTLSAGYWESSIHATSNLPAGVTMSFELDWSSDGGTTWLLLQSAGPVVGPVSATSPVFAGMLPMTWNASMTVPVGQTYQVRFVVNLSGGTWTTGATVTTTERIL